MATVGKGPYAEAVHQFFQGISTYDVEAALAPLADDADLQAPWANGPLRGKQAIRDCLEGLLQPSLERPSWTIADVDGDGSVTKLTVSQSGRFGKAPQSQTWRLLHLNGKIHHIVIA